MFSCVTVPSRVSCTRWVRHCQVALSAPLSRHVRCIRVAHVIIPYKNKKESVKHIWKLLVTSQTQHRWNCVFVCLYEYWTAAIAFLDYVTSVISPQTWVHGYRATLTWRVRPVLTKYVNYKTINESWSVVVVVCLCRADQLVARYIMVTACSE